MQCITSRVTNVRSLCVIAKHIQEGTVTPRPVVLSSRKQSVVHLVSDTNGTLGRPLCTGRISFQDKEVPNEGMIHSEGNFENHF